MTIIQVVVALKFLTVHSRLVYMLHHLEFGLVDFFMDAPESITPGDHELGELERVCLVSLLLELGTGCFAKDLIPRFAVLIRPREPLGHYEYLTIQPQHFGIGHWIVATLKCLDWLFQERKLATIANDRLH